VSRIARQSRCDWPHPVSYYRYPSFLFSYAASDQIPRLLRTFSATQRNEEREDDLPNFAVQTVKLRAARAHLFNAQPKAPACFSRRPSRRLRLGVKQLA
jgi:hypothetical protein